jgi:YebC/PmpR family DNA-binding regulatory protein
MAGHSHWAGIKHKKAIVDAKRGKVFSKIAKQIAVCARHGGGDPDANLSLKYAIDRAKAANMPKDNIERAIKKGTGELGGESYEEIVYEGYGPGGVAIMLKTLTDNRNRTGGEVRRIFEKHGGSIGKSGCVAWQFEMKSFFLVSTEKYEEDQVLEAALDGGADDVEDVGDSFEVTGPVEAYEGIKSAFEAAEIETESASVTNLPSATVALEVDQGRKCMALIEVLDDHDDVDSTDTNLDVTPELMAAMEEDG